MDNVQVILIVLGSVLVGALVPVFVGLSVVLFRAARGIEAFGRQIEPTLAHVQLVSERIEVVSRGLEGGGKTLAELLAVTGHLARDLERSMKMVHVASTILAAAVPAVAVFVQTMRAKDGAAEDANDA